MIEHKMISYTVWASPIPDTENDKQLTFAHQPTEELFIAALPQGVIDDLNLSNDELQEKIDKTQAEAAAAEELAITEATQALEDSSS